MLHFAISLDVLNGIFLRLILHERFFICYHASFVILKLHQLPAGVVKSYSSLNQTHDRIIYVNWDFSAHFSKKISPRPNFQAPIASELVESCQLYLLFYIDA